MVVAGVDADTLADFGARINRDVRKQIHFVSKRGIVADKISRLQYAARAGSSQYAFAHHAMRPDVRGRVHRRAGGDGGQPMDAGGPHGFGKKKRERLGKGNAGIWHANENFLRRVETLVGDDGRGGAGFGTREKFPSFSAKVRSPGFGLDRRWQTRSVWRCCRR